MVSSAKTNENTLRRVVVVTGVSRGLGRGFLDHLLETGQSIIAVGRNFEPDVRGQAKAGGLTLLEIDLAQLQPGVLNFGPAIPGNCQELVFINNAATVAPIAQIGNPPEEEIIDSIRVNYFAPILIANHLVALARQRHLPLTVLNISSGATRTPIAGWSIYCSTKSATAMFFNCLAEENEHVMVENIDPSVLDTDMQRDIRRANEKDFPRRAEFAALKSSNMLADPKEKAHEILTKAGLI